MEGFQLILPSDLIDIIKSMKDTIDRLEMKIDTISSQNIKQYLSVKEYSQMSGVHANTVRSQCMTGKLAHQKTSQKGKYLIHISNLKKAA